MKQTGTITSKTINVSKNSPTTDTDIPITPSVPSLEVGPAVVLIVDGYSVSVRRLDGTVSTVTVLDGAECEVSMVTGLDGAECVISTVTGLDCRGGEVSMVIGLVDSKCKVSVLTSAGLVGGSIGLGAWLVLVVSVA